jgi:putative inorganic carbon (HCO3(-)) transporter
MEEIIKRGNISNVGKISSIWKILIIVALGIAASYSLACYSVIGTAFLFISLLFLFYFGLGIEKTLWVLLFLRINLDAFHSEINISLSSLKTLSLPSIVGIFILFLGVFHSLSKRSNLWKLPVVKAGAFFALACLFSLPFSQNLANSLSELIELFSFMVLFLLIVDSVHSEKDIKKVVNCLLLSAIIPLAVGLIQILNNIHISMAVEPSHRIYSTLTHPNAYAFYLVIVSVLTISLLMGERDLTKKTKYFILMGFLLISLTYTFTRGAWLGLVFAIFILGLLRHRRLLIFLPLVIGFLIFYLPFIVERFQSLFNPDLQQYSSVAWRIRIWTSSIPYFLAHPIFGNGFGSFILVGYQIDNWFAAAHNDYLRILVETGVVGFLGFIWILLSLGGIGVKAFKNSANSYHRNITAGFTALLGAYMLMSFSDNLFNNGGIQWYFWAYAGVVTAIYRIDSQEKATPVLLDHRKLTNNYANSLK